MNQSRKYAQLEEALCKGGTIHGFRSGGGLRVLRLENKGKLLAYGEHPLFGEALRILREDLAAGGREYYTVYGKKETHYLTGTYECPTAIDACLAKGHTIDISYKKNKFLFVAKIFKELRMPEWVMNEVKLNKKPVQYELYGILFEATWEKTWCVDGSYGVIGRIVHNPTDGCGWFVNIEKTVEADFFLGLLPKANAKLNEED